MTQSERHLLLFVEILNGQIVREPVHVAELAENHFRLLYSPGLVQGIAAGDEFRLLERLKLYFNDGLRIIPIGNGILATSTQQMGSLP